MIDAEFVVRVGDFRLHAKFSGRGLIWITGENGSGKTTLLRSIAGLLPIESGYINLNGRDVSSLPLGERHAVYVEQRSVFSNLQVRSHLDIARRPDFGEKERAHVCSMLGIDFDGRVSALSLGSKIRVAVATAILSPLQLLLLDEVLASVSRTYEFLENLMLLSKEYDFDIMVATPNPHTVGQTTFELIDGSMRQRTE
ncbi:MAG: ATP-binding cassette domain-containing protein [Methanomassiliicoccales archaeon]